MCPSALAATSGMSGNAALGADGVGAAVLAIGDVCDAPGVGELVTAGCDTTGVHADKRTTTRARLMSRRYGTPQTIARAERLCP